MTDELKEVVVVYSRQLPGGVRKTTGNLSQDSQCPSRDSSRAPTKYKSRSLPPANLFCEGAPIYNNKNALRTFKKAFSRNKYTTLSTLKEKVKCTRKLSPCAINKHHAMKEYGEVEIGYNYIYILYSYSCSGRFIPVEGNPGKIGYEALWAPEPVWTR
jgi:hypothetical protein